jgi:hypothetical protein
MQRPDRIPRLLVENPTTNFSIADAIMDVIATLTFSSILLVFLFLNSEKGHLNDVASVLYADYYCYDYHRCLCHHDLSQLFSVESSFTYIPRYSI